MKQETFKKISWGLKILIAIVGAILFIVSLFEDTELEKPLSYLATMALPFAPDFIKLFGLNMSARLEMVYELFLIPAMVLGIDLDWYKTVLVNDEGFSYYDKIVHIGSGVGAACLGKEILDNCYKQKKRSPLFTIMVMVGFVAMTAVLWEIFEFAYDQIFGGHMQQLVSVGIDDTMWDMIGAMAGGFVTAIILRR